VLVQFEKLLIHAAASARRLALAQDWKPFKRFGFCVLPRHRAKATV
jgi:hypothetical protein